MKLTISEEPECGETEITIRCPVMDDAVLRIIASIRAQEKKLTGLKDGKTYVLEPDSVFYCDSVDKRTFLYTAREVYETPLRLYELEERLAGGGFFRASKAAVINLAKVQVLNPMFGGKIEVVLENGERLLVSRQYVPQLKSKLGL